MKNTLIIRALLWVALGAASAHPAWSQPLGTRPLFPAAVYLSANAAEGDSVEAFQRQPLPGDSDNKAGIAIAAIGCVAAAVMGAQAFDNSDQKKAWLVLSISAATGLLATLP